MTPTALNALADRVEASAGRDVRLDAEIECARPLPPFVRSRHISESGRVVSVYHDGNHGSSFAAPFTSDLSAAARLIGVFVPEGTNWTLLGASGAGAAYSAHLMQQSGYAWSPERALVAALLRAAAAQIGEG